MIRADRWQRAQSLFEQLIDQPPESWAARLAALEPDAALRSSVLALLAADRASGAFIDDAIAGAAAATVTAPIEAGATVGAYRLLRELGRGGMGTVFLAERADDAYRAQVAVKFLGGVFVSPDIERRFAAERQILADLDHPSIARLIDGGRTAEGTPYLVMEYVDGAPLDRWCETQACTVPERVALIRQLCDAVQHAHQALVVHRDIKPANILVTAAGAPKLLDFGIAKLLETDGGGAPERTLVQALTPGYASPEQLRGEPVTTASDTYSLGVVLYRLLARVPPYELAGLSPAEVERRVAETRVAPPSSRAPAAAARQIDGDLDTIVLKALHTDPTMRYRTASSLAEDLRRWQAHEPIAARRDTIGYRVRTFVRRHPTAVTASALATAALVALATTSVIQAGRATRQRAVAEQRQRVAESATGFLVDLFALADPNSERDGDIGALRSAREMLDEGARRVREGEVSEPEVRATLAVSLATIYRNLALYDEAAPLIDSALAVRARTAGPASAEYAAALHERAEHYYTVGAYDSTVAVHQRVLAIQARAAPGDDDLTERTLWGLGVAYDELSRFDDAERYMRAGLAMRGRLEGDSSLAVAREQVGLAAVLRHTGRLDEAIALLEGSLARQEAQTGRQTLEVAQVLNHLARTLLLAGRAADALPRAREAVAIQRTLLDGPHPETAASLGNVSGILAALGRYDEAAAARLESLAMLRASVGAEHPYVAATLNAMGDLLAAQERWPEAADWYAQSLALHRATLGADNPNIARPLVGLARVLIASGRSAEAAPLLREAGALYAGAFGDDDERVRDVRALLDEAEAARSAGDPARGGRR